MMDRNTRRLILLAVSWTFGTANVHAQDEVFSPSVAHDIDKKIQDFVQQRHVVGLSAAIANSSGNVWISHYGTSDIENGVAVEEKTVFRIPSIAKVITATATMQLAEGHKLDLDAPIQKYCPAFPEKQWPITARQLLAHTSGVRHYKNVEEVRSATHYHTVQESLDFFKAHPLEVKPDIRFGYTTFGYSVLGCAIEGAAGTDFERYLRDHIFSPAGMSDTQVDDVQRIVHRRARGYRLLDDGTLANAWPVDTSNKIPGGGLVSTAADLVKFAVAFRADKLVASSTRAVMWSLQPIANGQTPMGLGWGLIFDHSRLRAVFFGLYLVPSTR